MPTTYAIPDGRTVMAATTYTGNGSTQAVSNAVNGVSFQPDLVWAKNRNASAGTNHAWYDSVRGVKNQLVSNSTGAEVAYATQGVTAFSSGGFTVVDNANGDYSVNGSGGTYGGTYVGWQWKAGGTAVSNTSGSITSQVSANTTAGFSVVTYTGTGANATVGHGLGVAPSFIILKSRNNSDNWYAYHSSIGNTGALNLNLTGATITNSGYWNNTSPTSSVISLGTITSFSSSWTYVAYCFAAVAGYSAFGSYTGNGSSDGPFTYLGFRPRFVMWKLSSTTGDWQMWDSSRDTYNVVGNLLDANLSNAEASGQSAVDFLSNGFKNRSSSVGNASGQTYIYAAFAENPFKYANAR